MAGSISVSIPRSSPKRYFVLTHALIGPHGDDGALGVGATFIKENSVSVLVCCVLIGKEKPLKVVSEKRL